MEVLRKSESNQNEYLKKKTAFPEDCEKPHQQGMMCGVCFWKGITMKTEYIPECQTCKEDTEKFGRMVKENPRAKCYEFEPDCFKACMWWEWFHNNRKTKCGCSCLDVCVCGKIKYGEKRKTVQPKIEKIERKKPSKK